MLKEQGIYAGVCVCVCVCVYLIHFVVQQKLTQYCKATAPYFKK